MKNMKKYVITYLDEDGNEEVMEVIAYSRQQAVFLSGKEDCIVDAEETVGNASEM